MDSLIQNHKVLVFCGSGGVGKTTLSAACAVRAAMLGKRVLVLTIDPAKRLATSLGIEDQTSEVVRVPQQNFSGEIFAAAVDPEKVFAEFIHQAAPSPEAAERLLKNALYQQLATTFSGSQEFTSLRKLLESVESEEYDLVILDTPPAQHAEEFLAAPQKIYGLFQESVTKWFSRPTKEAGWMQKLFNQGTKTVFLALEKITGTDFVSQLTDFFVSIHAIQHKVRETSEKVQKLLTNKQTSFVIVTGFEESRLDEAKTFYKELKSLGHHLNAVIVNRAFPSWEKTSDYPEALKSLHEDFTKYHRAREEKYRDFQSLLGTEIGIVRLPDMNKDIYGLESLELLSRELHQRYAQGESSV